jgi:polyhydroxyalkanoate synthesis regulator phasin
MPDGDIVHSRLRRLYQKPYKWLCEGTATSDECARVVLEKLKRDIKAKGDLPVELSQAMADSVAQIINNLEEARESDFAELSMEFDALTQRADGRPDLKELTLRAGKGFLNDLRNGQEVDVDHVSEAILGRYMHEVYESEFKERIPLTSEHHAGVTQSTLEKRIEAMQPVLDSGIQKFAQSAIRNQSVAKLSMPRRSCRKAIDLDEDLLVG